MMRFYFSLLVFALFLCTSCDKAPEVAIAESSPGIIEPTDFTETRSGKRFEVNTDECFSVYI